MNPWIIRFIVIGLAIALLPLIVGGTASLVSQAVNGISEGVQSLISPFSMSGEARLEGIIRLCLYLIAVTLLARFLVRKRGGG